MLVQKAIVKGLLSVVCGLLITSCSTSKYAMTDNNRVYKQRVREFAKIIKAEPPLNQSVDSVVAEKQFWVGTVNMGMRKPNFVVIHHTAQNSVEETLRTFTNPRTQVSAHYIVSRYGGIYQMANDYIRAWHAGAGRWGNDMDINSSSIGVELDNNGNEPYPDAQINSLCALLGTLKKRHNIPTSNFIGHADLAPTRKQDPNKFPWKVIAKKGYSFWYDDILPVPPAEFDTTAALRIMGYDIRNLDAAIVAFKRHFVQTDISPNLTEPDKLILFNLYKKYM